VGAIARHAPARALSHLRCILACMQRTRWAAAIAAATALVLIACNSAGTSTDIRDSAEQFFRALAADPPRAYTHLSEACREELPFLEFASGTVSISLLFGESEPSLENLRVIRANGDELEAEFDVVVHVNGETVSVVEGSPTKFVKEDGQWRFSSCDDFGLDFAIADVTSTEPVDEDEPEPPSRYESALAAEADASRSLPGQYVDLPSVYGGFYGNDDGPTTAPHTRSKVDYEGDGNTIPPAGGSHWGSAACGSSPPDSPPLCGPVPWGVYSAEWDAESLVHSMEHGGVIIWFNTTERDIVDELETLVTTRLNTGDLLVMAPYLEMEDGFIALTSWSRIDKFPVADYSPQRVVSFLDAHVRRFNPEGF